MRTQLSDRFSKSNWFRGWKAVVYEGCIVLFQRTIDGLDHLCIYAKRDIADGEELTIDYKFDAETTQGEVACMCGAPTCRGKLGVPFAPSIRQSVREKGNADNKRVYCMRKRKYEGARGNERKKQRIDQEAESVSASLGDVVSMQSAEIDAGPGRQVLCMHFVHWVLTQLVTFRALGLNTYSRSVHSMMYLLIPSLGF